MIRAILFSLALALPLAGQANAQTTPTPQTLIGDREAAIITGFFDRLNEAQTSSDPDISVGDILRDVLIETTRKAGQSDEEQEDEAKAKSDDDDDDEGNGKKNKNKNKKKKNKNKGVGNGRGDGLPPGLAKQLANRGSLPPGLNKQLQENGALPPGLSAVPLPEEFNRILHDLPEGQERVIADNDVLIVDTVTGVILDSLPDVIPPDLMPVLQSLPDLIDAATSGSNN